MKRAFIVGNGPSLNETPLELLNDEVTFAVNSIHLLYHRTTWRPTYYWMVDYTIIQHEKCMESIRKHIDLGISMWLLKEYRDGFPESAHEHDFLNGDTCFGPLENVTWVTRCEQHHFYSSSNSKGMQEWHLPEICTAHNSISGMMQLAVTLGYGPLYLIGCDAGYVDDKAKNHFVPDYIGERRHSAEALNFRCKRQHEIAARCSPVPIFDATVGGGHLNIHEKVDLWEVLDGPRSRQG